MIRFLALSACLICAGLGCRRGSVGKQQSMSSIDWKTVQQLRERGAQVTGLDAFHVDFSQAPQTNNETLQLVCKLSRVEILNLDQTQVTDTGLELVGKLQSLQTLKLAGTKITDAALKSLAKLEQLSYLRLPKGITGAGLAHLVVLKNLARLEAPGCQLGENGMMHIAKLSNLNELNLNGSDMRSTDTPLLRQLPKLLVLNISYTEMGDDAVKELGQLKQLGQLDALHARFSEAGRKALRTYLRKTKINFSAD